MKNSIFDITTQNNSLSAKIVAGIERISEAFKALLWDSARMTGLSPIQIQILIFICYHDKDLSNVSHLAREFNVTKPTISDAVKVLEQKNLIKKVPSSIDKRGAIIQLTPQGKKIIEASQQFANPVNEIVEQLNMAEQEDLFNHIRKIILTLNHKGILTVQRMCLNCKFYEAKHPGHFCHLMQIELKDKDIRIDCAEYENKPAPNRMSIE